MLWHRRHERDPAQRWLRDTVERSRHGPRHRRAARPHADAAPRGGRRPGLSARRGLARRESGRRVAEGVAHGVVRGIRGRPACRRRRRAVRAHRRRPRRSPPLLLLHGYPQTHVDVAARRARARADFSLVIPDLRGYGDSTKPAPAATPELDHAQHSKRAMAADMVALMRSLGHERFAVVGHDRGGRVAHRLALDHPERVARLARDRHRADARHVRGDRHALRELVLPLVLPDPAGAAARADDRRRPGASTCAGRSAAGARHGLASSSPRRSPSTSAASAAPTRSTPPARTTAPRRRSTSSTTARRAPPARRSPARRSSSGASAASSAACSIRSRSGGRSARRRSRAGRWRPATSFPKSCPTRRRRSCRLPATRR